MNIYSRLLKSEKIENAEKKFGAATEYYPLWVQGENSTEQKFALFTEREVDMAVQRGTKNPEDVKPPVPTLTQVWDLLLRALKLR